MTTPIIDIKGIGSQTAENLAEFGFKYAEDLLKASVEELAKVHGFGPARAKLILKAAKELCDAVARKADKSTEAAAPDQEVKEKKKSKKNKDKKANKKNKKNKKKKAEKDKKSADKEKKNKKKKSGKKKAAKKKK